MLLERLAKAAPPSTAHLTCSSINLVWELEGKAQAHYFIILQNIE